MVGYAVGVVVGERVRDLFPGVDPAGRVLPVLPSFDRHEIQDLERSLLGREMTPPNSCFPETLIQTLNDIGAVGDFAELGRELEKRDEVIPGIAPRFDHRRIFGFPIAGELFE